MDLFKQNSTAREDLGLLAVMDALVDEEQVTQRELSRKTGLNLKKVNYCLHKLLEKGYVKFQRAIHNPDKRAYFYILTPSGMKAKSRLTYRFLKFTLDFYNQVETKLEHCLAEMESAGVKRLVLYGATEVARIVQSKVNENGLKVVGVLDCNYEGQEFSGVQVLTQADLVEMEWDGLLVTALDDFETVESKIESMDLPNGKVWQLQ